MHITATCAMLWFSCSAAALLSNVCVGEGMRRVTWPIPVREIQHWEIIRQASSCRSSCLLLAKPNRRMVAQPWHSCWAPHMLKPCNMKTEMDCQECTRLSSCRLDRAVQHGHRCWPLLTSWSAALASSVVRTGNWVGRGLPDCEACGGKG